NDPVVAHCCVLITTSDGGTVNGAIEIAAREVLISSTYCCICERRFVALATCNYGEGRRVGYGVLLAAANERPIACIHVRGAAHDHRIEILSPVHDTAADECAAPGVHVRRAADDRRVRRPSFDGITLPTRY